MKPLTQREKVVNHMNTYGSITSIDAFYRYQITRLSAIMHDLYKDGVKTYRKVMPNSRPDARATHHSRYSFDPKKGELFTGGKPRGHI